MTEGDKQLKLQKKKFEYSKNKEIKLLSNNNNFDDKSQSVFEKKRDRNRQTYVSMMNRFRALHAAGTRTC
jgi:hypothetical protein